MAEYPVENANEYIGLSTDTKPTLTTKEAGSIFFESNTGNMYVWGGAAWTQRSASGSVTGTAPYIIMWNTTQEDSDGGRESRLVAKGEQSGGEVTTLGYWEFSHEGSSDDEKGQAKLYLNDGNDGNSPSITALSILSNGRSTIPMVAVGLGAAVTTIPLYTSSATYAQARLAYDDTYFSNLLVDSSGNLNIYGNGDTTNYSQFEADGTLVFHGTATVYDDKTVTPGSFDRPGVSDPAMVQYVPGGSGLSTYLWEFAKNDIASFVVQIPHKYQQGENIEVHIHWTPGNRGTAENGNYVGWKVDWTWANVDGVFGSMQTADLSDVCDGTNHKHQMTPSIAITGTSKTISSMLQCNVKRTDTGTDDTWVGTASGSLPMLLEIDFHFPIDTVGSRLIGSK